MQIEITKQSEKDFRFLLSRLSHEIRNPVTLINSELQLMASSHPELCSYRQWDSLMDNLEYVKELLKELSDFSKTLWTIWESGWKYMWNILLHLFFLTG